jgi:hypothetical protein
MAILKNLQYCDVRGCIDRKVAISQYSGCKTVLSSSPNMTNIKPSDNQKKQRLIAERKAFYKEKFKRSQWPHNVLISELLKKDQPAADTLAKKIIIVSRGGLNERQLIERSLNMTSV